MYVLDAFGEFSSVLTRQTAVSHAHTLRWETKAARDRLDLRFRASLLVQRRPRHRLPLLRQRSLRHRRCAAGQYLGPYVLHDAGGL